ncbi:MAG: UDP-N-acetylglucosamine 2-epimerase (non-hydrolyzing) [Nitrospinota bacterium]|nr:UDP-N-acetylglucosamine 2-epimerase (non-hydrolyzing) [Nitrospinota bacterium]
MKILNIVGARPNFMKIAPIMEAMKASAKITPVLLHTGQHYDSNMNDVFFDQLGIPRPDIELGVGSGGQAWQIAETLRKFDPVLEKESPDVVLVVGDVNATVACSLAASYKKIPVIHVEAGLRSFDRSMPEEINRMVTDRLSEVLFITETSARANLLNEGVPEDKIQFVGNVMVDTLLKHRENAAQTSRILDRLQLPSKQYAVMTLHRPSNVDDKEVFSGILKALNQIAGGLKIVFAVHPRTRGRIEEFGLEESVKSLILLEPQPYLDMVHLMSQATMVLTDSGGIQEETSVLGVPCLTVRENTERPVTIEQGTNTLVGTSPEIIVREAEQIIQTGGKQGRCPELWDGRAAERIVRFLEQWQPR